MKISELLQQPESKTLEFKRDLSSLDPIIKTIIAFANTAGGILIIGLANDGNLFGIADIFKAEERLASAIADNIYPTILPEIEICTIDDRNLLIVRVPYWRGPFYLKKLGVPQGVYVRLGSTSRPAGPALVADMQRSLLRPSFDEEPIPDTSVDNLDMEHIRRAFQAKGKTIDTNKLLSLGILTKYANKNVCSVGGMILFGREAVRKQLFPDAKVSCARFRGNDKSEFIDRQDLDGSILDAIAAVPAFIVRNTRLASEIKQLHRRDIAEYPSVALREVLINAVAHCDYSIQGSRIQIAIFSNRLEIQNPGMLPFGFTLDDLKAGTSRVRNRVIARVFNELGIMESWGSGYNRVMQNCLEEGYLEPTWQELGDSLRVTFQPHAYSVIDVSPDVQPQQAALSPREQAVLHAIEPGQSLPTKQIAFKLSHTIPERSLRTALAKLRDLGLVRSRGSGRATVWERPMIDDKCR